jgi:ATP-dependent Clp protease ATP-binding subunit ClpA
MTTLPASPLIFERLSPSSRRRQKAFERVSSAMLLLQLSRQLPRMQRSLASIKPWSIMIRQSPMAAWMQRASMANSNQNIGPHHPFFKQQQQQQREKGAALKEYGIDLTERAAQGKLDPVIGREEIVRRTIQVGSTGRLEISGFFLGFVTSH